MTQPVLILFSRHPDDTTAKSRLRTSLPDRIVNNLHRAFVLDTMEAMRNITRSVRCVSYWASLPADGEIDGEYRIQEGEIFIERLTHCLQTERENSSGPLLVIGSDCPLLSPAILDGAIDAASTEKLVLGPAQEGGFYLMGIPEETPIRDLSAAFKNPLEILGIQKLYSDYEMHLLPRLYDIDLAPDLASLFAEIALTSDESWKPSHTAATLQLLEGVTQDGSRNTILQLKKESLLSTEH